MGRPGGIDRLRLREAAIPALAVLLLVAAQADLVEKLRSDKVEERDEAETKLKELGRAALPELEKAAKSADPELAARARRLLQVIPVRVRLTPRLLKRFPGLDERLSAADDPAWTAFFREVAKEVATGEDPADLEPRAHPDIDVPLKDGDRSHAGLPFKGEDLAGLLENAARGASSERELEDVFELIWWRNLHSCAPALLATAKDPQATIRVESLRALAHLRTRGAAAAHREALGDADERVRAAAARGLGEIGGPEFVPDLVAQLEDPVREVRGSALLALQARRAREAAPAVARCLADPDETVRAGAAHALAFLGTREIAPALVAALGDPCREVRQFAASALGPLKIRGTGPAVVRLVRDADSGVRRHAVGALFDILAKDAIPILELTLDDPEDSIRRLALRLLGALDARASIPRLIRLLSSDTGLRVEAARILSDWGVRESIPTLIEWPADLNRLNRFRRTELWERLRKTAYAGRLKGPRKEIVAAAVKEAGLAVEWPAEAVAWASESCEVLDTGDGWSILDQVLFPRDLDLVLEEKTLRILPHAEARDFWKAWWAAEEKKK